MRGLALVLLCAVGACAHVSTRGPLVLRAPAGAVWSPHCVPAWQPHALPGKRGTRYDLGSDAGSAVIRARADASASMLRYTVRLEPDLALVPGQHARFLIDLSKLVCFDAKTETLIA